MMRVADFVMSFLEGQGVRDIFVVTGGGAIFLDDALGVNKNIRYYCCHHEQAVAMAAEAYARVKGNLGVSLVTTGPGGTNTITGVCGSWTDSVPHLIISGQVFLNQTIRKTGVRQLGVQEINIIDIVKPVTKYAVMIEDTDTIKYHLQKAVHIAKTGRPGPVWIDIPANIQNAKINEKELAEFDPAEIPVSFDPEFFQKVAAVAERLITAKRPLLHAGQGIKIASAVDEFMSMVEKYRFPFVTARNANDMVESDHELFVGRPGTFAQRGANFAVQNADVYLAIGTRLSLPQTGYNSKDYARNAWRVMVDIDTAELNKDTLDFHCKIQADARAFLQELSLQLESLPKPVAEKPELWVQQCRQWKEKYPVVLPEYKSQQTFVNSYYFIDILSDLLTAEDVIVTDMGLAFQGTHQAFKVKKGQKLFTNSGFASMGWGLPAAIGACIAHDRKRTICLAGDGGLQMNLQELATVMHHQFPIKIFVYNNKGYLTQKQSFQLAFGRVVGSDYETGLSFPDLKKIADAYEISYFKIEDHTHLREKVEEVVNTSGPMLCELIMDPDQLQIPKSQARKRADGSNELPPFEDLFPYLDPQEVKENMVGEKKS